MACIDCENSCVALVHNKRACWYSRGGWPPGSACDLSNCGHTGAVKCVAATRQGRMRQLEGVQGHYTYGMHSNTKWAWGVGFKRFSAGTVPRIAGAATCSSLAPLLLCWSYSRVNLQHRRAWLSCYGGICRLTAPHTAVAAGMAVVVVVAVPMGTVPAHKVGERWRPTDCTCQARQVHQSTGGVVLTPSQVALASWMPIAAPASTSRHAFARQQVPWLHAPCASRQHCSLTNGVDVGDVLLTVAVHVLLSVPACPV